MVSELKKMDKAITSIEFNMCVVVFCYTGMRQACKIKQTYTLAFENENLSSNVVYNFDQSEF